MLTTALVMGISKVLSMRLPRTAAVTSPINLALGKTASQSSTYGFGEAFYAVDGNREGSSPWTADLQHTITGEFQSWWQVDLGAVHTLRSINLYNRTSGLQSRLNDFYVLISENPFSESASLEELLLDSSINSTYFAGAAGLQENLSFDLEGRYVRIQLSKAGSLHMAEVEIIGCSIVAPLKAKLNDMSLSPNPGDSFINVSFDQVAQVKSFIVFDISGRIIQKSQPVKGDFGYRLNVTLIPLGTYILRAVDMDNKEYYKNMVIKR